MDASAGTAADTEGRQGDETAHAHFDVVVVGAGLSGIGAAWHLKTDCPNRSFTILEARNTIGGTWDLFRYPGVRSDSDMHTLGYPFRPWQRDAAIADGASIRDYIEETACESGLDSRIRFGERVVGASWDSATARWTVQVERGDERLPGIYVCRFLYICSGYYDYEAGHRPEWPGMSGFRGRVVYPQHWPEGLDYAGKKIIVIGSGATAVTLVPAMAPTAAHVTMLQRSPGYVFSLLTRDPVVNWMRRRLPVGLAATLARWKGVLGGMAFYSLSRRFPDWMKRKLIGAAAREFGPSVDATRDLTPSYDPWDQRLCFVPDGNFYRAVRSGRASIVTDRIARFASDGIELASGRKLEADIVVSATGLKLKLMGGMTIVVDGRPVVFSETLTYRAMMLSDVPNMAFTVGYANASWTLKCGLTWRFVSRVLNHMERNDLDWAVSRRNGAVPSERGLVDLSSGYIQRAAGALPKQGAAAPWKMRQNYVSDYLDTRFARLEDGALEFGRLARVRTDAAR